MILNPPFFSSSSSSFRPVICTNESWRVPWFPENILISEVTTLVMLYHSFDVTVVTLRNVIFPGNRRTHKLILVQMYNIHCFSQFFVLNLALLGHFLYECEHVGSGLPPYIFFIELRKLHFSYLFMGKLFQMVSLKMLCCWTIKLFLDSPIFEG